MHGLSVSDILRYLIIGLVPIGLLFLTGDGKIAITIVKSLNGIGLLLFAFSVGAIFYTLYRPIIYSFIIMGVQDLVRKALRRLKLNTDNHRTFLIREFHFPNSHKAEQFWYFLSPIAYEKRIDYFEKQSSMIHLLYQSALIVLIYYILRFYFHSTLHPIREICYISHQSPISSNILLIISGIFFINGFLWDYFFESYICGLVKSLKPSELRQYRDNFLRV